MKRSSGKRGCARCVDLCPAGAIASTGDKISIDPFVCGGCGLCAAVCPTGATAYAMPGASMLAERLRTLLSAYHDADGPKSAGAATILFHDTRQGEDAIAMMARFGDGLPANVIPVAVNETTQLGLDAFAPAFAHGAAAVRVLLPPSKADRRDGLANRVGLTAAILAGLGFHGARIGVIDLPDPLDALAALSDVKGRSAPAAAERILMCEDCRVVVQFDAGGDPFKSSPRPPTRTTMDDLREREIEAAHVKSPKQREQDGG